MAVTFSEYENSVIFTFATELTFYLEPAILCDVRPSRRWWCHTHTACGLGAGPTTFKISLGSCVGKGE